MHPQGFPQNRGPGNQHLILGDILKCTLRNPLDLNTDPAGWAGRTAAPPATTPQPRDPSACRPLRWWPVPPTGPPRTQLETPNAGCGLPGAGLVPSTALGCTGQTPLPTMPSAPHIEAKQGGEEGGAAVPEPEGHRQPAPCSGCRPGRARLKYSREECS